MDNKAPKFLPGKEMGEDALRVLGEYRKLHLRVRAEIKAELTLVRAAVRWVKRV
jgi:hypothetical protein